MWTKQFSQVVHFDWILLKEIPQWEDVERSAEELSNKKFFNDESDNLFDQYNYLKKYVTDERIIGWNNLKTDADMRWVEIVKHFKKSDVPFDTILQIAEFVLCLPGTSAPVERVFSAVNKIWTADKSRLAINTLNDIIKVKYNIKLTCQEFYTFLKSQPALLRDILKKDKYEYK